MARINEGDGFAELQSLSDLRGMSDLEKASKAKLASYTPDLDTEDIMDNIKEEFDDPILDSDKPELERESVLNERIAKKYENIQEMHGIEAVKYAFDTAIEKSSHKGEPRKASNIISIIICSLMIILMIVVAILIVNTEKQSDDFYNSDVTDYTKDDSSKLDNYIGNIEKDPNKYSIYSNTNRSEYSDEEKNASSNKNKDKNKDKDEDIGVRDHTQGFTE